MERKLAFDVTLKDGPDVGLYTDMREVRAWLESHWGGRRVLNTFAYTGAFSVAAACGGASSVTTVDLSAAYLDRAEINFRANDLEPGNYDFIQSDVFKAMDRLRRTGELFDLVILDPPAFSHSDEGIWSAKRDMPRLVASALRLLDEDGWVLVASNQGEISPKEFRGFVVDGARKAGFKAQEIWFSGQGPDCPAATWFPEGRYLKVGVWRRLPN
jgi:23S rRNA (cytosine1962-C5)-methyltransferase